MTSNMKIAQIVNMNAQIRELELERLRLGSCNVSNQKTILKLHSELYNILDLITKWIDLK